MPNFFGKTCEFVAQWWPLALCRLVSATHEKTRHPQFSVGLHLRFPVNEKALVEVSCDLKIISRRTKSILTSACFGFIIKSVAMNGFGGGILSSAAERDSVHFCVQVQSLILCYYRGLICVHSSLPE